MSRCVNSRVGVKGTLIGSLGILLFGILLYSLYRMSAAQSPPSSSPSEFEFQGNSAVRQETTGLKYSIFSDAKPLVKLDADRVSIEKRKMGFFRLGFLNEARLENAFIRVYVMDEEDAFGPQDVNFQGALEGALPQLTDGKVSAVFIQPVKYQVCAGEKILSTVSAQKMSVSARSRAPVFEGDVRVEANGQILHAQRIRLLLGENTLVVEGPYTISGSETKKEGYDLTTDIFLRVFTKGNSKTLLASGGKNA